MHFCINRYTINNLNAMEENNKVAERQKDRETDREL